MKKILLSIILLFSFFTLSAEEDFVSFSTGLSTGVPFYGSSELSDKLNLFSNDNNRSILGATAALNINMAEQITIFTGADVFGDFNWNEKMYCHILSVDFSTGIKIYPGLRGFDFGLAYSLGYRADYSALQSEAAVRTQSPLGNGYKLFLEYNFAHDGFSKYLPTIGIYWKRMPRGNNEYDNYLTAYISSNL